MPAKNEDLHGSVPDKSDIALLIIDVINDLEFADGDQLLKHAMPMAHNIRSLKKRAKKAGIPVVYVNDNYGKWQSNFDHIVDHCSKDGVRGKEMTELLKPDKDDYIVIKPKHSGFFSTTLDTLLEYLKVKTLIMTGVAGNICVLFTANDAYMRDFNLRIPRDCIASNEIEDNERAITLMEIVLGADTTPSDKLQL